jgi:hypothetical protein
MIDKLKESGLYPQMKARNTKRRAEALAAHIREKFGFVVSVDETSDMYL